MENFRVRESFILKSLRFSSEQWEKIVEFGESENCKDSTDAVRTLIDAGLWLEDHKKQLQDPEKNQELIDEYNKRMEDGTIFDWLGTQSNLQLEGLDAAIKLEKEKRLAEISIEMGLLLQILIVNLDNIREVREKFLTGIAYANVQKILSSLNLVLIFWMLMKKK